MNFEYYYGTQADQFSFIRIPRILLLDEAFSALSLSAKVLYSVLLDRMGLSMKNKWLPTLEKCEHKNSFIYILLYKFRFVSPIISHARRIFQLANHSGNADILHCRCGLPP